MYMIPFFRVGVGRICSNGCFSTSRIGPVSAAPHRTIARFVSNKSRSLPAATSSSHSQALSHLQSATADCTYRVKHTDSIASGITSDTSGYTRTRSMSTSAQTYRDRPMVAGQGVSASEKHGSKNLVHLGGDAFLLDKLDENNHSDDPEVRIKQSEDPEFQQSC